MSSDSPITPPKVERISNGSNDGSSLLPPQNATNAAQDSRPRMIRDAPHTVSIRSSQSDGPGGGVWPWFRRKNLLIATFATQVLLFGLFLVFRSTSSDNGWLGENFVWEVCVWGAVLGALCSLIVIVTALMVPVYRKHPNRLLVWRALCSLGMAVDYLLTVIHVLAYSADSSSGDVLNVTTVARRSLLESDVDTKGHYGDENRYYQKLCEDKQWSPAILTFFFVAGECWYLCQALDLHFALQNPFYSFKGRMVTYHLFSWTVAVVISVIPWIVSYHHDSVEIYGFYEQHVINHGDRQLNILCWFNSNQKDWSSYRNPLVFWLPVACIWLVVPFLLYKTQGRLSDGLSFTFAARLRVFAAHFVEIGLYSIWWFLFVIVDWVLLRSRGRARGLFYALVVYMICTKGVMDLMAWFVANDPRKLLELFHPRRRRHHHHHGKQADIDRDLQPQVNVALRAEILHYITSGIRNSIKVSELDIRGTFTSPMHVPDSLNRFYTGEQPSSKEFHPTPSSAAYRLKRMKMGQLGKLGFVNLLKIAINEQKYLRTISEQYQDQISAMARHSSRSSMRPSYAPRQSSKSATDEQKRGSRFSTITDLDQSPQASESEQRSSVSGEEWNVMTHDEMMEADLHRTLDTPLRKSLLPKDHEERNDTTERPSVGSTYFRHPSTETSEVLLLDFKHDKFRRVREHFHITPQSYIEAFKRTAKERLTEGGSSGAFFFYSGCERYMVKSCSQSEFKTLLSLVDDYTDYLCSHPPDHQQSLLVRIYGAYVLKLYNTDFHFFVMENIFDLDASSQVLQQRYDLKGSWVKRSMATPREGQTLTCRHCNQKYTYRKTTETNRRKLGQQISRRNSQRRRSTTQTLISSTVADSESEDDTDVRRDPFIDAAADELECPFRPVDRGHEPNLILKDNDLNFRMRFEPQEAGEVVEQLERDAAMLARHGIMDYSLLIGVRIVEYEIMGGKAGSLPIHHQADTPPIPSLNSIDNPPSTPPSSISSLGEIDLDKPALPGRSSSVTFSEPGQRNRTVSLGQRDFRFNQTRQGAAQSTSTPERREYGPEEDFGRQVNQSRYEGHVVTRTIYYIGVIDILQRYDWLKKLERFWKTVVLGYDAEGLSAIDPQRYYQRFVDKVYDTILVEDS